MASVMKRSFEKKTERRRNNDLVTTSCERCRKRKIKCDRRSPCTRCGLAGAECKRGPDEKSRPIPKSYVQALEGHIASLELLIAKLSAASPVQRDKMLMEYRLIATASVAPAQPQPQSALEVSDEGQVSPARARVGQLCKIIKSGSSHFYGGTSLFQIPVNRDSSAVMAGVGRGSSPASLSQTTDSAALDATGPDQLEFLYGPHDNVTRHFVAEFFKRQYDYNMFVYREYFLRDYHGDSGPYYSDLLVYAICTVAAVTSNQPTREHIAQVFYGQAQTLLYRSLDSPNLTTLQALLLLGQYEIGRGRSSKGWLLCGMGFRLAHEMGLHLDPGNWANGSDQDTDKEVFRRVYWGAFLVDKQLSLYFGRPPALYPQESDVRDPVRLPYPAGMDSLLKAYGIQDESGTALEDGPMFVGSFIYQAELSKILHVMIIDLFENRRTKADDAVIATTVQQVHVSLNKWLMNLPGSLHWNQWTVGKVPSNVIHLHLLFHTAMIILHRPPIQCYDKPDIATSEDVEICYESLQAILRLLRIYSRYFEFKYLPLDFVYTLATAAGTILMRRYLDDLQWEDAEISRSLGQVLQAMDDIRERWPCVVEIRDSILHARNKQTESVPNIDLEIDIDFMTGLAGLDSFDSVSGSFIDLDGQLLENDIVELASSHPGGCDVD